MEFTSAGEMQLLSSDHLDDPTEMSAFPPGATETIQLTDGVGFHVFVVLASPDPLPEIETWKTENEGLPWEKFDAKGIWRFSNGGFEQGHFFRERSTVRQHQKVPAAFKRLCEFIVRNNEKLTVEAIGFQIQPLATDSD